MPVHRLLLLLVILAAVPALAEGPAEPDTLMAQDIATAESLLDSLRFEIRRLDRDLQHLKLDFSRSGELDLLLEALTDPEALEPDAPKDTRSRRQRVDTLLKAMTQRPGQLRFNGSATVIMQSLLTGDAEGSAASGSFDLYAHTSFGPGTLLFFAFEAGGGEGFATLLPLASPLNGDAAPTVGLDGMEHLVLNEAWGEFTALNEAVTMTAGKIDLTNYFDINRAANDETSQFLAAAFVNNAALPATPPAPGVRARSVLFRRLSVQGGIVSSDGTGGSRFRDPFRIGSLGVLLQPDSAAEGNLRAFLYSLPAGGGTGWGLSLDQDLGAGFTAFGRYGDNDDNAAQRTSVRQAASLGMQWVRPGRGPRFAVAAAYGNTTDVHDRHVTLGEMYASWQINPWTYVSPLVQIVKDETFMGTSAVATGFRIQFNF